MGDIHSGKQNLHNYFSVSAKAEKIVLLMEVMKMTVKEELEKLNKEMIELINIRRKVQACNAIEIITKDETLCLFNNPEDEKKYIICFMEGLGNRIRLLNDEIKKIKKELPSGNESEV